VNPLLRDLSESTDCRGVIFVSPYLKASPARGAVYFALLGALLAVSPLRWKIARGFLKKTASPAAIPKAYCDLCGSIERGLFEAVREKSVWRHDGLRSLGAMAALPVLLVYGEQDAVDGTAESVALIRGVFPNAEVVAVPTGGHALPWTHTHLIAQSIAGFIIRHGGH
jgi:pimeloyl-ACP methyl ester carboxylesterase